MKLVRLNDSRFRIAFTKLMAQPVSLKVAFKLKGIAKRIEEESVKFEEVRKEALMRYGAKDDKGEIILNDDGTVKLEPEQLKAFADELNQLGETEIEVGTISLAELGSDITLSTEDAIALDGVLLE